MFLNVIQSRLYMIPGTHTIISMGWAGYLVTSSFNKQEPVVAVAASWTVPKVNASAGNGYSSVWVGIGGQAEKTLIQVGTEHNLLNGQEFYDIWYELLPDYAVRISNFTIAPGHVISAGITLVNDPTDLWNVFLIDTTTGQCFSQNFAYNTSRSSAEWIVERCVVNKQISNLAGFDSVSFTDCTAELGQTGGVIGNFTYSIVHMTNENLDTLATALPLNVDGASFTVDYLKNS